MAVPLPLPSVYDFLTETCESYEGVQRISAFLSLPIYLIYFFRQSLAKWLELVWNCWSLCLPQHLECLDCWCISPHSFFPPVWNSYYVTRGKHCDWGAVSKLNLQELSCSGGRRSFLWASLFYHVPNPCQESFFMVSSHCLSLSLSVWVQPQVCVQPLLLSTLIFSMSFTHLEFDKEVYGLANEP